ncbi:hypothetical protein ONZ45_g15539 [Pleurotus djamor]|nr:hypothetical protein ONZ45_g15539 [Pleurotus djamor]
MPSIPVCEDYVQPPQPTNATHVYGLVLPSNVALKIGKALICSGESEDEEYDPGFLQAHGDFQANLYCQTKFQDLPLQWRKPVLGFVKGSPTPLIVFGHRNPKKRLKTIYVNPEQLERMRKTLGLGDDAPKWYKISSIN